VHSIARGPHFTGLQFTHWSTLGVRKFWSAVYPLVGPQVHTLPQPVETECSSTSTWDTNKANVKKLKISAAEFFALLDFMLHRTLILQLQDLLLITTVTFKSQDDTASSQFWQKLFSLWLWVWL